MAKKIFTREAVSAIMANEELTPEQRTEQVFSLWGRALDDAYIDKTAAQQAQQTALDKAREQWEKDQQAPDIEGSEPYQKLKTQFDDYKTMQQARGSEDYKDVKAKFFETVYGMVDRSDGAKPVKEQLEGIRGNYEEYFNPAQPTSKPTFGAPLGAGMPKGDESVARALGKAWGFVPDKQ